MATGTDIVNTAQRYKGLRYVLGAEAQLPSNLHPNPVFPSALDCSELVELVCHLNGVAAPDGTVNQLPWCDRTGMLIPLEEAINTPGALLFIWVGPNAGGGRGNHVAISRGDGTTIEARGRAYGVGNWTARHRGFNYGARIPGIDYRITVPVPPLPAPPPGIILGRKPKMFQFGDGTGAVFLWDGEKVVPLGGLPSAHVGMHSTGVAPFIGHLPPDEAAQLVQRLQAAG
jgi:cell wall-associated NlpC family hydrolase